MTLTYTAASSPPQHPCPCPRQRQVPGLRDPHARGTDSGSWRHEEGGKSVRSAVCCAENLPASEDHGSCWQGTPPPAAAETPPAKSQVSAVTPLPRASAAFPLKIWPKAVDTETQTRRLSSPSLSDRYGVTTAPERSSSQSLA